ncbi:carbohydrate kinase family protein [Yinghuangia seranimata]|uniref:carbohydrate kinase family protein n=1 Tax=Yinghuangia seranimata TaxID=408067 RepID=UPI00248BAAA8|nr:carbohydrate kinase [Yinghuangia seranimata]MDI2131410.1 carbohydrate kinase [Yinghuangia seranimata]
MTGTDRARVAVAGENVVDLVPTPDAPDTYRAVPGGSPANTAIAAARLGTPAALIARIGADAFGRRVRERLAADGVSPRYLVDAREPSSLAVLDFDEHRRASYDFWFTGTADAQWSGSELPDPLDPDVLALHVGSVALHLEPGGTALLRMILREHARGAVTLTLDPNIRPDIAGDLAAVLRRLEALVPLCDVVKASEDDLTHLYPDLPPVEAARLWRDSGPALVVVTQGPHGATAVLEHQAVAVAAPDVPVADTVGAGDAFMGALLHGLDTRNLLGGERVGALRTIAPDDLSRILEYAAAAASYTCTRPGADPPTGTELDAWITAVA